MKTPIIVETKNSKAIKELDGKNFEGLCIGLADGKVVAKERSIARVMEILFTKYKGKSIAVTSFPKRDKTLVV